MTDEQRFSLWAKHDKVNYWIALYTGLRRQLGAEELVTRQDRIRRNGQPCRFRLLPDGERP